MDIEPKGLIANALALPFRISFPRQRNTAVRLFGPQLRLPRSSRQELLERLAPLLEYYPQRDRGLISDRVCAVILSRQRERR